MIVYKVRNNSGSTFRAENHSTALEYILSSTEKGDSKIEIKSDLHQREMYGFVFLIANGKIRGQYRTGEFVTQEHKLILEQVLNSNAIAVVLEGEGKRITLDRLSFCLANGYEY